MDCDYDDDEKPRYIFVIGAPGAGKGALCGLLADEFDFFHISVGNLLRKNAHDGNIKHHLDSGELLPSQYLFPVLREAFRDCPSGRPILLDGFPRRPEQIREFEKAFRSPELVLFFHCPHAVAKSRVLSRNEGRPGDYSEMFEKRYRQFLDLNPPILDHYADSHGKNKIVEVHTGEAIEVSWERLLKGLKERKEWKLLSKL